MSPHRNLTPPEVKPPQGPSAIQADEIHERFSFHPALSTSRRNQHDYVRQLMERTALALAGNLPNPSRGLALALTALEEAMHWANQSLALAPDPEAEEIISLTPVERGERAYAAYGAVTSNKTFLGDPMPAWEDLGDTIQSAWIAAANIGGNL